MKHSYYVIHETIMGISVLKSLSKIVFLTQMMNIDLRTDKRKLGDMGENMACLFLEKRGFKILDRNYLRKWGELDIVATKDGIIRFVEVKSVKSREDVTCVTDAGVIHETLKSTRNYGEYRPEDNMHPQKLKRLARVMQTYMIEKKIDSDYQLDLITVKIDEKTREARVEIIENIVV